MRVLFASSEVFPLIKTGGLADVSGALPAALQDMGLDVCLLMPAYPEALTKAEGVTEIAHLGDPFGIDAPVRLLSAKIPGSQCPIWLIHCPALYDRIGGPYQDANGADYEDNHFRFGLLSWVAAHLCSKNRPFEWVPDILHCHDWQAGLAPAYLEAWQETNRPATIFTIHNIAYQGQFPPEVLSDLRLPERLYQMHGLEYYDSVCFLKSGLYYSDRITTVSPRYAREIQSFPHGCGMEGLLAWRSADLCGILNGADYGIWNPAADPCLDHPYPVEDYVAGKAANKAALQAELGLSPDPDAPLMVIVSRLNDLKGMDLVLAALPTILRLGGQLAVLGTGDKSLEDGFRAVAEGSPTQIAVRIGYSEALAHKMMAAGDMMLMPSRFEPCGLTQFYAFRYGTVPLVHATGGLADTVVDAGYDSLMTGTATGYSFEHDNAGAFQWTIERAVAAYRDKGPWRKVQSAIVSKDFGWKRSAERYVALYQNLVHHRRHPSAEQQ